MPKKRSEKTGKCDNCKKTKKNYPVTLAKNDNEIHASFCKTCKEKYEKEGWKTDKK